MRELRQLVSQNSTVEEIQAIGILLACPRYPPPPTPYTLFYDRTGTRCMYHQVSLTESVLKIILAMTSFCRACGSVE